jgi:aspartate racemase
MAWHDNKDVIIGIVGGMGSYATLDLFKRCLEAFPAERDWERPRIIIDNYSTIPSRVRAILYNENVEELEQRLSEAVNNLLIEGATDIVLACHTSHFFMPYVMENRKSTSGKIYNLIEQAKEKCDVEGIGKVSLLASEGTIQADIYGRIFGDKIEIAYPNTCEMGQIRELIEAVKQNKVTYDELGRFKNMIENSCYPVILGCSELPVLMGQCKQKSLVLRNQIIDPLQCVIDSIAAKYQGVNT